MIEADAATLAFYDAEAPVYAASGPGGASRHLAGFIARLSPGARVLELGCGGGRDTEAMLAADLEVDATDGSPALAEQARKGWVARYGFCASAISTRRRPMTRSGPRRASSMCLAKV